MSGPAISGTPRYDHIVVGGGSAGCVVASRLAEAGQNVLLLEAGPPDRSLLLSTPGTSGFGSSTARYTWGYDSEPQDQLAGRRIGLIQARVLGGGSSINGMVYTRGFPSDYDRWRDGGCPGWGYDDVLPAFRRSESSDRGQGALHGGDGPLRVSKGRSSLPICDRILEATYQAGYAAVDDFATPRFDGFGYYDFTIGDGIRSSAAAAFLRGPGLRGRPQVHTRATVSRLLMDHGAVRGIELIVNARPARIWADGEVILCAGAVNTAKLLLLSGIGDAAALTALGIPVVLDQPNVGRNYQNHMSAKVAIGTNQPITAYRYVHPVRGTTQIARYMARHDGFLAEGLSPVGGFFRSDDALALPDLQLFAVPALVGMGKGAGYRGLLPQAHGFSLFVSHSTPRSRGTVRLRSNDPADAPIIAPNYFEVASDLDAITAGIEKLRIIADQPALRAVTSQELRPGSGIAGLAAVRQYAQHTANNQYHPAGTCRMGEHAEGAVVDAKLCVHGIKGLRIADASVMPDLVNGNTNAPVIMIAERAADFILSGDTRERHAGAVHETRMPA